MINSGLYYSKENNDIIILSSSDLACVSLQHSPKATIVLFYGLSGYCLFNITVSEKPLKSSNMSQFKYQHVVGKEANKLNLWEMPKEEVIQTVERSLLFSKGK